jgi:hypothetical protein
MHICICISVLLQLLVFIHLIIFFVIMNVTLLYTLTAEDMFYDFVVVVFVVVVLFRCSCRGSALRSLLLLTIPLLLSIQYIVS